MRGALVAGDVMTTATVGAKAARIGDTADLLDGAHGDTEQAAATASERGAAATSGVRDATGARGALAAVPENLVPQRKEPARHERDQRQEPASVAQSAPPSVGVRRRLARLGAQRGSGVNPVLEPLSRTIRATHPKADIRMVERAYEVAAHCHRDQKRKSGDPYITHPLAVATILAELGMNTDTICAALLHDTVEDTPYTLVELRGEFGEDVAALVDGVTKLDKVKYGESAEAETVRKMVVAMSRDIRVLVIKLADRLHNMRTLRYMPRDKQERKSRETLEI